MSSWVRYSVAVYVGLLLAGSVVAPLPERTIGAEGEGRLNLDTSSWLGPVRHDAPPHRLDPLFDSHWLIPVHPEVRERFDCMACDPSPDPCCDTAARSNDPPDQPIP